MTCRGSRFNPTITQVGKESNEWLAQNQRSTRNFIRKWGHFVKHDRLMKPIIPPKFNIGLVLESSDSNTLFHLEPWFDKIWVDSPLIEPYIDIEQKNTIINLKERVRSIDEEVDTNIVVRLNALKLTNETFNHIQQLAEIIDQHQELGTFELGNLNIEIHSLEEYQESLIFI